MFVCVCQDGEDEAFKDLAEEKEGDDDDDEEEHFVDADKAEEGASAETKTETKPAASWVHHQNLEGLTDAFFITINILFI